MRSPLNDQYEEPYCLLDHNLTWLSEHGLLVDALDRQFVDAIDRQFVDALGWRSSLPRLSS